MSYIISFLFFIFIAWLILRSINKMIGEKKRFVIMSPFKAKITYNGKALKNTQVKLNYSWNTDKENSYEGYDEYFATDDNGLVEMPAIVRKIFVSNIQPTVSNYRIELELNGGFVKILIVSKKDPSLNGEFGEELQNMTCEIEEPLLFIQAPEKKSNYITRCDWPSKDKWKAFEM